MERFYYRAQIAVCGPAVFSSHADEVRVFERALRRADLPVVFTEGFNPRPLFSFGQARPLGYGSLCDYIEFVLSEEVKVEELTMLINEKFPEGFCILSANIIHEQEFRKLQQILKNPLQAVVFKTQFAVEVERTLNDLFSEAGNFFINDEVEKEFLKELNHALRSAKILDKKIEGRVFFFRQSPPEKSGTVRLDKLFLGLSEEKMPEIFREIQGIYFYSYKAAAGYKDDYREKGES